MCEWNRWGDTRIDPCMRPIIEELRRAGVKTLACCCGHGKYPRTVVVDIKGKHVELYSSVLIPRKRRFYRRDPVGVYYIPETL